MLDKTNGEIRAYPVRDYPSEHHFFNETQYWKNYWSKLYSKNKHTNYSKGFLKINFEK